MTTLVHVDYGHDHLVPMTTLVHVDYGHDHPIYYYNHYHHCQIEHHYDG